MYTFLHLCLAPESILNKENPVLKLCAKMAGWKYLFTSTVKIKTRNKNLSDIYSEIIHKAEQISRET